MITQSVRHDTSPPLRDMIAAPLGPRSLKVEGPPHGREIPNRFSSDLLRQRPAASPGPDALRQSAPSGVAAPPVLLSAAGYASADNIALLGGTGIPPDTNGDVGADFYIQYVNIGWLVLDKADLSVAAGPFAGNTFWTGFGGFCETDNSGDPIVLYDHLAGRWVFSQFTSQGGPGDGHQCFAVSTTGDPLGPYHRYDFVFPDVFNDYPKVGVWDDAGGTRSGYYLTTNDFFNPVTFAEVSMVALERDDMLTGAAATMVRFLVDTGPSGVPGDDFIFATQPGHLEGNDLPAAGTCNRIVQQWDDEAMSGDVILPTDGYLFWELCVDWATPASSTLTGPTFIDAGVEFESNLCGFGACIPQPGTGMVLDTLAHFTMYRAANRVIDGDLLMVLSHAVNVLTPPANQAGVRWVQFDLGGGPSILDQGVYAPDSEFRWMPSIAMDQAGNIGTSYSLSSSAIFPAIRFTGRAPGDPAGTMRDETSCVEGGGSQTGADRWGDYSSISVDPVDGCTFWLTSHYQPTNGTFNWNTRVCSFQFDGCVVKIFEDGFESGDCTAWSSGSCP